MTDGMKSLQNPHQWSIIHYPLSIEIPVCFTVIRCSIVFDDFKDLYRAFSVVEEIAEQDLEGGVLRLKDRFHPKQMPFGYRDLLVNVYCMFCPNSVHFVIFLFLKI